MSAFESRFKRPFRAFLFKIEKLFGKVIGTMKVVGRRKSPVVLATMNLPLYGFSDNEVRLAPTA